jgi:hypothetical protein
VYQVVTKTADNLKKMKISKQTVSENQTKEERWQ